MTDATRARLERQARVVELREKGFAPDEIALILGVHVDSVRRDERLETASPSADVVLPPAPMLFDPDIAEWALQGICAGVDPEIFFPEKGGNTRDAKRVCTGCPVRRQCLEYALSHNERFGIWGGTSERERRRLQAAVRLAREGYSVRQIVEQLGLTEAQVREVLGPSAPKEVAPCAHITDLPIRALEGHPGNVRRNLGDLTDLALTIREHGVLQPLLVERHHSKPSVFVIIDGHRRFGAVLKAGGITHVPVRVRDRVDQVDATLLMLVTALQKEELDPLDEAAAYRELMAAGHTQASIAAAVGKHQAHISQRLALTHLTEAEKQALRRREIGVVEAYRTGRDRSSRRMGGEQKRPKPRRVPHFTGQHPLAGRVEQRCRNAGHEVILKLGPGCGPCWETEIRADALGQIAGGEA